jgi:hypothetical protein
MNKPFAAFAGTVRRIVRRLSLYFWIALRRCPVCYDRLHRSFALRYADPAFMECLRCRCVAYGSGDTTGWWIVGARRLRTELRKIKNVKANAPADLPAVAGKVRRDVGAFKDML